MVFFTFSFISSDVDKKINLMKKQPFTTEVKMVKLRIRHWKLTQNTSLAVCKWILLFFVLLKFCDKTRCCACSNAEQ